MKQLQVFLLPFLSFCIVLGVVFFVPPTNLSIIFLVMFLISFLAYALCRTLFRKKISVTVALFIFLGLFMILIHEFNFINIVLLLSLMTGALILVK